MKNLFLVLCAIIFLASCNTSKITNQEKNTPKFISTQIDLKNVVEDKVQVVVQPNGLVASDEIVFHLPKIVPGTYAISDFGDFITELKAFNKKGETLTVTSVDNNSWKISNASQLDKITYWVNDTFDAEDDNDIYVMAGTNIEVGKNFFLNLHGFVGYFENMKNNPYQITVTHPSNLIETTSLTNIKKAEDNTSDTFYAERYEIIMDDPLMYSESNNIEFVIDGIKVNMAVYSPNGVHKAEDFRAPLMKMMQAQSDFLEGFNTTDEYNILVYLNDPQVHIMNGGGALEHPSSTTVVMSETTPKEQLVTSMINHIISHEFFHIVSPLSVHSEEIHNFNFNTPDMSEHLWMYEGTTEYFAHLFQVREGLIGKEEFLANMQQKIGTSMNFADDMSFTKMSKNILEEEFKGNYMNVYMKGALISMCLDIIMREETNGAKGWREVMLALSQKYGKNKPFQDETIIAEITAMTNPKIGAFLQTHVVGETPIDYNMYFAKAGITNSTSLLDCTYFLDAKMQPFLDGNEKGEIFFTARTNTGLTQLGVKANDVIKSINGVALDSQENIQQAIGGSFGWTEGSDINLDIERNGKPMTLKGKAITPKYEAEALQFDDIPASDKRMLIRNTWLKLQ